MRRATLSAALVAALAVTAGAAAAAPPVLRFDAGKTGAVSGPYTAGGMSLSAAALWPVEEAPWALPIRFGVMAYWDDMGSQVGALVSADHTYLGLTGTGHQAVFGGAFRLDWQPALRSDWAPYASATWGYYRVADDLRGAGTGGVSAPGFSLGAGLGHTVIGDETLGAVVRYHRLFDRVTGRYMSVAVEWGWRGGR